MAVACAVLLELSVNNFPLTAKFLVNVAGPSAPRFSTPPANLLPAAIQNGFIHGAPADPDESVGWAAPNRHCL